MTEQTHNLTYDGLDRSYLLHVPPAYDGSALPLIVVLHGAGETARGSVNLTKLSEKADAEGFIVAYPNGTGAPQTWNVGYCCGDAQRLGVDDVGFVRKLIDEIRDGYAIDPKRILLTGVSNGGMLAHRVAATHSDIITAIAPVAAAIGGRISEDSPEVLPPKPMHPVSVIMFHGMQDRHIPYAGGEGARAGEVRIHASVARSVAFWVTNNGCVLDPETWVSENGTITRETWGGGREGSQVVLYTIEDGGHSWPGASIGLPGEHVTHEISATDLMCEFFVACGVHR